MLKQIFLFALIATALSVPDGWCDPNLCQIDPDCPLGCDLLAAKKRPPKPIITRIFTAHVLKIRTSKGKYLQCTKKGKLVVSKKPSSFQVSQNGDYRFTLNTFSKKGKPKYMSLVKTKKKNVYRVKCNGDKPFSFTRRFFVRRNFFKRKGKIYYRTKGMKTKK